MKTFVYPMVVLLCLGFTGCKKLVSFDMEYDNSVVIPANSIINFSPSTSYRPKPHQFRSRNLGTTAREAT